MDVNAFIQHSIRLGEEEKTPLMTAAVHGCLDVAEALLKGGADIDKVADNGFTALKIARDYGHTAIVKLLLDAGATE